MIRFEGVKKAYGDQIVVNNLDFEIKEGETFCLLGKSGSGKTTTLKMINKLIPKDAGNILINNQNIDQIEDTALRKQMGYVIQNVGLFPHLTIEQNIAIPLRLIKTSKTKIKTRVLELLEQIGLDESYLNRFPSQLSGGQQQRIGIARAIANKPGLLLMDEPFSALDPVLRDQMQSDFLHMSELKGITKVIVTHDINEALKLGDRICLLANGEISYIGDKSGLLNSSNPIVQNFLGEDRLLMKFKNLTLENITKNLYSESGVNQQFAEIAPTENPLTLLSISAELIKLKGSDDLFKKDEILLNALKDQS